MSRSSSVSFGLSAATLVIAVGGAVHFVSTPPREVSRTPAAVPIVSARSVLPAPFLMFRTLAPPQAHGRVAMIRMHASDREREVTRLSCDRVHYAGGTGLCLVGEAAGKMVRHVVYFFDGSFTRGRRTELTGVPIRARVSPDGRRAAVTVYAEEESPSGERLASESIVIDVGSGRVLADLREFAMQPSISGPVDISGVAFADGNRFFATLSTPAEQYLVEGSIDARQLTIVHAGLANEALSPDGKSLAVKRRTGTRSFWQLLILDLGTMTEKTLNQGPRSVDDQVEWLDEGHLVYHDATDEGTGIWRLPINGTGGPELVLADAFSPAVAR